MSDPRHQQPNDQRRAWRTESEWQRLRGRIDAAASDAPLPRRWTRYAGGLVAAAALAAAALIARSSITRSSPEWHVVTTAAGGRVTVRLGDSSAVTLGPATTLRYAMSASRREVELDGLAHFTVVHDATRPFLVRAKNAVATDLGTEFVMRAYASDSAVSVAVTSGIVSLSGAVPAQSVKLVAGDVGRVDRSGQPRRDAIASAATSNAWLAGRLIFENQPLTQVVAELNRWFNVDIRVPDGPLSARRVTALYSTPTLAGVLDALTSMLGARYEQQGRVITLHPVSR